MGVFELQSFLVKKEEKKAIGFCGQLGERKPQRCGAISFWGGESNPRPHRVSVASLQTEKAPPKIIQKKKAKRLHPSLSSVSCEMLNKAAGGRAQQLGGSERGGAKVWAGWAGKEPGSRPGFHGTYRSVNTMSSE